MSENTQQDHERRETNQQESERRQDEQPEHPEERSQQGGPAGRQTGEPGDASQREDTAGTQTGPGVGSQEPGYDNPDSEEAEQGRLSEKANEQAR